MARLTKIVNSLSVSFNVFFGGLNWSQNIYIQIKHQVQTRRNALEWVSAKLMIIYFFIPQISETNEDRGAGAREEREPGRRSGSPGGAGSGIYKRAGHGSRNWKGSPLLFITAKHPVKDPRLVAFFYFHLSSTEVQKKILDARKRKFILNIDTDEIGYLSKSVTFEVMNEMT